MNNEEQMEIGRRLERAKNGDQAALKSLLEQDLPFLLDDIRPALEKHIEVELARKKRRCSSLADDVWQTTLTKTLEKVGDFELRGSSPYKAWVGWVKTIATHACIDEIRKQSRQPTATDLSPGGGESPFEPCQDNETLSQGVERRERESRVRKAINQLASTDRAIAVAVGEGKTHQEIADLRGKTSRWVRDRFRTVKKRLRALLGRESGYFRIK